MSVNRKPCIAVAVRDRADNCILVMHDQRSPPRDAVPLPVGYPLLQRQAHELAHCSLNNLLALGLCICPSKLTRFAAGRHQSMPAI